MIKRPARGPLGWGYVVIKPNGELYVSKNGQWIFDREGAKLILATVGGKMRMRDAAYYA